METGARRTISTILAVAAACGVIATTHAAPQSTTHKPTTAAKDAKGHGPKFRPPRGAAAADAKRLGALVGKECTGRADMQRNEHQWVVLCSNGKSFVVEPVAAHQPAAAPVECSLAGTGPEPACFP
jgi:hypothetical protein